MNASFVTWQLKRLHEEIEGIDRPDAARPQPAPKAEPVPADLTADELRDRALRRLFLDQLLRALPRRLGFRSARAFANAFARANQLNAEASATRHRLTPVQVRELERRVLNNERPRDIARALGCAEQTVLNRSTQFRKRLARMAEQDASGI